MMNIFIVLTFMFFKSRTSFQMFDVFVACLNVFGLIIFDEIIKFVEEKEDTKFP